MVRPPDGRHISGVFTIFAKKISEQIYAVILKNGGSNEEDRNSQFCKV